MKKLNYKLSVSGATTSKSRSTHTFLRVGNRPLIACLLLVVLVLVFGRHLWPYYSSVDARSALRFFEAVALQSDTLYLRDESPGLRRWEVRNGKRVLRIRISTSDGKDRTEVVMSQLSLVKLWTDLSFRVADKDETADIIFRFVKIEDLQGLTVPEGLLCLTAAKKHNGNLQSGLTITISQENEFCLNHEILHAIGLPGHWNGNYGRSALGSRWLNRSASFSKWDSIALRTLYDERLDAGLSPRETLDIARTIIAELVSN